MRPGAVADTSPGDPRVPLRRHFRLQTLAVIAGIVLLSLLLRGQYRRELYHLTGEASWMWVTDDVAELRPLAGVFVHRFDLTDRPKSAVAKVCGDREFVLWVNGHLVTTGHNRPGFTLEVVPVTDLMRPGSNVIAVEAASPTPVGAVLFALDLEPGPRGLREGDPRGRSAIVSGRDWRVLTRWDASLLESGTAEGSVPWIWGRPPDHPWSYPVPHLQETPLIQAMTGELKEIPGTEALRVGPRRWEYRLGERFVGLLWVRVPGGGAPGWTVRADEGQSETKLQVITVPGRDRWLAPEIWRRASVVLDGPVRAPDLEVAPIRR